MFKVRPQENVVGGTGLYLGPKGGFVLIVR